jgi:hypothetical protein
MLPLAAANSDQSARPCPGQPPAPCRPVDEQQVALTGHPVAAGTLQAKREGSKGVPAAGLGDGKEGGGAGMSVLSGSLPRAVGSVAEAGRGP